MIMQNNITIKCSIIGSLSRPNMTSNGLQKSGIILTMDSVNHTLACYYGWNGVKLVG